MVEYDPIPTEAGPHHLDIAKEAARTLGLIGEGNGMTADQVRIAKHETIVHRLNGNIIIDIKPDPAHIVIKGKQPRGQVVGSKTEAMTLAAAAAHSFLAVELVQKEIVEVMAKKPGRGFGSEPFKFKLAQEKKDYSVVDKCLTCGGLSQLNCTFCNTEGTTNCPACHGAGMQNNDSGTSTQCHTCQGQRRVRCIKCNGQGHVPCTECDASGFTTHVYNTGWQVETLFALERKEHDQGTLEVIDTLGVAALAIEEHAEIFLQAPEMRDDKLTIPYHAFLPIARADFSINGKNYPAVIAGLNGHVIEIEPFLDPLVKPGINALFKLSKGPMAAAALMETACKYRMIRMVVGSLAHHTRKAVYHKIRNEYPNVLSDKYARATIKYANMALMALSQGPRRKGLILGTAVAALISAAWLVGPMRVSVLPILQQKNLAQHIVVLDVLVLLICYAVTIFVVKLTAAAALKKVLPDSMQSQEKGLPAGGDSYAWGILTTLAVFVACAVFTAQKPDWILPLVKMLGL